MRDGTKKFSEEEMAEFRRRYVTEKLTEARQQYLELILKGDNSGEHKKDDHQ